MKERTFLLLDEEISLREPEKAVKLRAVRVMRRRGKKYLFLGVGGEKVAWRRGGDVIDV